MNAPSSTKTKRPFWQRFGRRLLWTVAIVATLIILFVQIANWRGTRTWRQAQERLVASGIETDYAALVPPPVPDADNFFATPILSRISEQSEAGEAARARIESLFPEGIPRSKHGYSTGLSIDFEPVLEAMETTVPPGGNAATAVLAAYDEKFGDILEPLDAAASLPTARLPSINELGGSEQALYAVALPHLSTLQKLARAVILRGSAAAHAGDRETLLTSLRTQWHASAAMKAEPILITQLVGMAFDAATRNLIWEGLATGSFTDEDLKLIVTALEETKTIGPFAQSLRGELAGVLDLASRLDGSKPKIAFDEFGGSLDSVDRLVPLVPQGWLDQNRATFVNWYLDYLIEPAATGDLSTMIDGAQKLESELIRARDSILRHPHTILATLATPALIGIVERLAEYEARQSQAIVACEIERFRLAEGRLPDDLGALVPRFLPSLPEMDYELEEGSYVLTVEPDPAYSGSGDNDDPDAPRFIWYSPKP